MTFRRSAIATVAAGLFAGATALAAPAQADTTADDFLAALTSAGITGIDPGQAVELGQSICPLLADRSQNTADIASTVADSLGRPLGPATMFTGIAVSFFCPRVMQDLASGNSPIPLDLLNNFGF
ncbi:DUF732 domain-containing protein [Mycobacterium sp. CVI_P3]|uniref:DUF732 domain-containing protein n=1 Tax=Mycobacterium pinniadriaticum TaxID=2994102 RepID=A0ABT3SDK3_9MYCO|nr:DUF732 domain-containing protein [Mycobacterium pinniadriaticum]MCX2930789.1 DUF732 domain-containing protein [Mycobacterium pinniadriaticum]MCX2937213.1 DUF732 domain-containing protein [Mycobacterium pinniadriaticum]